MNLLVDTTYRSSKDELMDDLNMSGELLRDTLDKIAIINKRLGGNSVTLDGIKQLLKTIDKNRVITIIDLGCGNGDMLREIAKYGKRNGFKFELIGVDANQFTIDIARELSVTYDNISFQQLDVFSEAFKNLEYDIALATLFIHHFKEEQIINLLQHLKEKAKIATIVNDLHRHKLAYYLFKMVCFFWGNKMVQHDGLISILRGFKKKELEVLAGKINSNSSINWKWAFRYQWIIRK